MLGTGGWALDRPIIRVQKKLMKKRIVMLVANDPDSDPRIEWEASYAPPEFAVTAMGVCGPAMQGPRQELRPSYMIVRLPRDGRGCLDFLRRGAELMIAAWLWPILAVLLLPLAIVAAVLELLGRGVKRHVGKRPVYAALRQAARFVLALLGLRIPIGFFRHVVISSAALWRGIVAERLDERAIVHCNDLETLLVGVMAQRAYGCKLVYDCHEFLPYAWPDATRWNRWLLSWYEGWLIRFADSVFTVSPLLAAEISKAYRGIEVQTVPNAEPLYDVRFHRLSATESKSAGWDQRAGLPAQQVGEGPLPLSQRESGVSEAAAGQRKPLEFLLQGSFGPERGIEELIRAWQTIDPRDAVLLLRGYEHAHKARCVRLAESLGLKDVGVFFLPPVSESCRIAAAAKSDIGIIPYKPTTVHFRYCCPNKLSEYMQAGLPLMAGNTDYVSQIVVESGAGLCYDPTDPESIASTVRQLVQDEALRQRCRQNGASFVRETFNWQARSKPLYDAYRRLAGVTDGGAQSGIERTFRTVLEMME